MRDRGEKMAKKNFDYCEDVSTLKQYCSKKNNEPNKKEKV